MTDAAQIALSDAENQVPPHENGCKAQLRAVLKRLADGEVRNKERFRHEGDQIYAAKARCGLRAYGWFQTLPTGDPVFVVAHATMKKKDKADSGDLERARLARASFQAGEQL